MMAARDDESIFDDEHAARSSSPRSGQVGYAACQAIRPPGAAELALGTLLCRHGAGLRLVVIAKAAFDMRSNPMKPVAAPAIHLRDVYDHEQRILVASDLVPGRSRVDVTVDGHARASGGRRVVATEVGLAVHQNGATVIDKTLRVVGQPGEEGPRPFAVAPLDYRRAYRGEGAFATPVGVDEESRATVFDPDNPRHAAGFGPYPEAWPVRAGYLTEEQQADLQAPVMTLGPHFDWRYFQTAPPDQQLDHLAPDATIAVVGMDADRPRLEAQLPNAAAVGAVYGLDPSDPERPRELAFRADSLHVHADRGVCVVCWRAVVEVDSEAAVPTLTVMAGVATAPGEIVVPSHVPSPSSRRPISGTHQVAALFDRLPEDDALPFQAARAASAPPSLAVPADATSAALRGQTMGPEALLALMPTGALPFSDSSSMTPSPKAPGSSPSPAATSPVDEHLLANLRGTLEVSPRQTPEAAPLPFRSGASRAPTPEPSPAEKRPTLRGQTVDVEQLLAMTEGPLPFANATSTRPPAPPAPVCAPPPPSSSPPAKAPSLLAPDAPLPSVKPPSPPAAAKASPPPEPPASEPPARLEERVYKVPSAEVSPKPERKSNRKRKKKPAPRATKRTDLNAFLYGKKS